MPDQTTNAAIPITDVAIEAAARVLADVEGWDYDQLREGRAPYTARAELALTAALDGHLVVDSDDYARLIQYRRDTLGLLCPKGHHTRFVDVLGDPNAEGYVCAHCAVRAGAVVELREPDKFLRPDAPFWQGYGVEVSGGQVWDGTRHLRPRGARVYAAELVSAAEHADRQAAEVAEVSRG